MEKTFTCRFKDSNYLARFDLCDNKYLIEFDGIQHFKPESFSELTEEKALVNLLINKQHEQFFRDDWCLLNKIGLL